MKYILTLLTLLFVQQITAQSLPFDFEEDITTSDFVDFDGGTATVISNPQSGGLNTSATVAQLVRDGGQVWAGSKVQLSDMLDFSEQNAIKMKVYTTAPVGTVIKLKLENGSASDEVDVTTTKSSEWEELIWDFSGVPANFNTLVFMFDFGNKGDGSAASTFLFDDVSQFFNGYQIDLPVDFEGDQTNYTVTDFGGNKSVLSTDPENRENTVIKTIKTADAASWAGTTIGTPKGFKTDIPLTLSESTMSVKVWSPEAGTPVRLKVEDSDDPTHTCETETNTTVNGGWEIMYFDFSNQAPGTESLAVGLDKGWTYNMASIFFDFGTDGATAGEETYYFDMVTFGELIVSTQSTMGGVDLAIYPNPSAQFWMISIENQVIEQVALFNLSGKLIFSDTAGTASYQMDNSSLSTGLYMLQITTGSGIYSRRLSKK